MAFFALVRRKDHLKPTIDDVRSFWDSHPLFCGELTEETGSEAWFNRFDAIKGSLLDLSDWIPKDIKGKKVLDIGCGPGYWHRLFGRMDVVYQGIDISPATIEIAKKSQAIFGCHGELSEGNAERLGFPDGSFDHVVSEGVVHHTPDTQACINEIYRVLRTGGTATVGVYYKNFVLGSLPLFKGALFFMRLLNISLRGRGREKMYAVSNPEEFVRIYDGSDNPIGKAYVKSELREMFSRFSEISFSRYYCPNRAAGISLPRWIQKTLNKTLGVMILAKVRK